MLANSKKLRPGTFILAFVILAAVSSVGIYLVTSSQDDADGEAFPSPAVGAQPSASPSPTPTPTVRSSPTPAGVEQERIHGDLDCSSDLDSVDALKGLRYLAGYDVDEIDNCPKIGGAEAHNLWGDVDCDRSISAVDFLLVLRTIAGFVITQTPGCAVVGQVGAAAQVGSSELFLVDAETGEVAASYPSAGSPMWSPDGDKIAFVAHSPNGFAEVIIADVTGNVMVVDPVLFDGRLWIVEDLLWSPDGDQLAAVAMPTFVPDQTSEAKILLMS